MRSGSSAVNEPRCLLTERNATYLPRPNILRVVASHEQAPLTLTPTSFVFPFLDDGRCVLVNHAGPKAHRGISVPGGHVDPGESLIEAAIREAMEETGATVVDLLPVGFVRGVSQGSVPLDHPYPHPITCQQFFVGRAVALGERTERVECAAPVLLDIDAAWQTLRRRERLLMRVAWRLLRGQAPAQGPVETATGPVPA